MQVEGARGLRKIHNKETTERKLEYGRSTRNQQEKK